MKNLFVGGLKNLGFTVTEPQVPTMCSWTYRNSMFTMIISSPNRMTREVGVATVPGSSFFKEDVHNFVRFHFAKQDATLNEALNRLESLREKAKGVHSF